MTSEVVVVNREAIALAADSATTMIGGRRIKIKTSSDKIFPLSGKHSVAFMVHGNQEFMYIPWGTIFDIFRKEVGEEQLDTIEDYRDCFIEFLENNESLITDEIQTFYYLFKIYTLFEDIKVEIDEEIGGAIDVAVISKGDGFVWVKRKKYYDFEDNVNLICKCNIIGKGR